MLIFTAPILTNKDVFEPTYNDLKFMVQNCNYICTDLIKSYPKDGGAWWAAVYGVAQSRTRLKRLSSSTSNTILNPGHIFTWPLVTTSVLQWVHRGRVQRDSSVFQTEITTHENGQRWRWEKHMPIWISEKIPAIFISFFPCLEHSCTSFLAQAICSAFLG